MPGPGERVLLFDGVCNLCNGTVQFVIDRDREGTIHFAPLQSETARMLLAPHGIDAGDLDSVAYIEGSRVYQRSAAALRVARRLRWPWPLLALFMIVPAPLRDWAYGLVAQRRYRWFGKSDVCRVPTPELRSRFLEG